MYYTRVRGPRPLMASVRQLRKNMNSELSSMVKVSISTNHSPFSRAFWGCHLLARVPFQDPQPLAAGIVSNARVRYANT
jgi:hypothetical protein